MEIINLKWNKKNKQLEKDDKEMLVSNYKLHPDLETLGKNAFLFFPGSSVAVHVATASVPLSSISLSTVSKSGMFFFPYVYSFVAFWSACSFSPDTSMV